MRGLRPVGPRLAAQVEIEAGRPCFRLRPGERRLRIGHAIARAEKIGNVEAFRRRIGEQKDRMLTDIHLQLGKALRQDLVETVMPDDAPGTGDLGVKIDLQHCVILWSPSRQLLN